MFKFFTLLPPSLQQNTLLPCSTPLPHKAQSPSGSRRSVRRSSPRWRRPVWTRAWTPCWPAPCWCGRITNWWWTSPRAPPRSASSWTTVTDTTKTSAILSSASCTTTSRWVCSRTRRKSAPLKQPSYPAHCRYPCPTISPGTCSGSHSKWKQSIL